MLDLVDRLFEGNVRARYKTAVSALFPDGILDIDFNLTFIAHEMLPTKGVINNKLACRLC